MSQVTVRRSAESDRLVSTGTVIDVLDLTSVDDIEEVDRLVEAASSLVHDVTGRVFGRELITERLGVDDVDIGQLGFSRGNAAPYRLMLRRTPILLIEAIRFDGDEIDLTDLVIESASSGFLYRPSGFSPTSIRFQQIEQVHSRFSRPVWEVDYSAGFVLPTFPTIAKTFAVGDVNTSTDVITLTLHGLVNGDTVRFSTSSGGTLPAPLVTNRNYFIRDADANTFKVSDEVNGSAVDLTDTGSGTHKVTRQSTLPAIISQCVVELVSYFRNLNKRDPGIISERLGDYQVQYASATKLVDYGADMPTHIRSRLERWREVA